MKPSWRALYAANADVVISGHQHHYERFVPQRPRGRLDRPSGNRKFVAGTGGRKLHPFGQIQPDSEVRDASTQSVLEFIPNVSGYDWKFVLVAGDTFTDSGGDNCH